MLNHWETNEYSVPNAPEGWSLPAEPKGWKPFHDNNPTVSKFETIDNPGGWSNFLCVQSGLCMVNLWEILYLQKQSQFKLELGMGSKLLVLTMSGSSFIKDGN